MKYAQESIKPYSTKGKKAEQVEQMFDNIAPAYDKLNHILSFSIDKIWRRKAIKWLKQYNPETIMDVATGTGDFAMLAYRKIKPQRLTGVDISDGMMNVGRVKVRSFTLGRAVSRASNSVYKIDAPLLPPGVEQTSDSVTPLPKRCRQVTGRMF